MATSPGGIAVPARFRIGHDRFALLGRSGQVLRRRRTTLFRSFWEPGWAEGPIRWVYLFVLASLPLAGKASVRETHVWGIQPPLAAFWGHLVTDFLSRQLSATSASNRAFRPGRAALLFHPAVFRGHNVDRALSCWGFGAPMAAISRLACRLNYYYPGSIRRSPSSCRRVLHPHAVWRLDRLRSCSTFPTARRTSAVTCRARLSRWHSRGRAQAPRCPFQSRRSIPSSGHPSADHSRHGLLPPVIAIFALRFSAAE